LVTLVEAYEQRHYKIAPPDPIEAIKFRMEQLGMKPADLAKMRQGSSGLCSESAGGVIKTGYPLP
jgi:HTH-type transcriptional regulator/antitoxin HigA